MSNQTTYTVKEIIDPGKEREWASEIGGLDWDRTQIVFTKRTLVEFLRYTGTSVNPNYGNIAKLPRYAQFGVFSDSQLYTPAAEATPGHTAAAQRSPEPAAAVSSSPAFIPTRKVREAPGGYDSVAAAFGAAEETLPVVRPPPREAPPARVMTSSRETPREEVPDDEVVPPAKEKQELDTWGNPVEQQSFKPTRRVREGPGGHDSLADLI